MKKLFIIIFWFISLSLSATTYYCATTGSDVTGDGSIGNPWKDPEFGCRHLIAGDTLFIRAGTYLGVNPSGTEQNMLKIDGDDADFPDGTAANPIVVMNYNNERVIFNGANISSAGSMYGIYLYNVKYWYIIGLEVNGMLEKLSPYTIPKAMFLQTTQNCRVERCKFHDNAGYGLKIYGFVTKNNLVINCDSYNNFDLNNPFPGANADGFSASSTDVADTNYFTGCRAWNISDDGFDFFSSDGVNIADKCWSWGNGQGAGGAGNGFKIGGESDNPTASYARVLTNCIAYRNEAQGFHGNELDFPIKIYNSVSYLNGYRGFNFFDTGGGGSIYKNNIADANYTFYVDDPIKWDVGFLLTDDQSYNSWNIEPQADYDNGTFWLARTDIVSADQFVSLDSTGLSGARQADGSLPVLTFLHLKEGSVYIGVGVGVGLLYDGDGNLWSQTAPSLGAFEYDAEEPGEPPTVPEVSTTAITTYNAYQATVGGTIVSNGGGTISAAGVCWNTTINPTTANSKITSSAITGAFSGILYRTLLPGTTYHIRAYTTNETGTSYGSDVAFTVPSYAVMKNGTKIYKYGTKTLIYK